MQIYKTNVRNTVDKLSGNKEQFTRDQMHPENKLGKRFSLT